MLLMVHDRMKSTGYKGKRLLHRLEEVFLFLDNCTGNNTQLPVVFNEMMRYICVSLKKMA